MGAGTAVVAGAPASVNTGVVWLNKKASQYWINGVRVAANVSAFTATGQDITVKKYKKTTRGLLRLLNEEAAGMMDMDGSVGVDAATQTVNVVADAAAAAVPRPSTAFVVLDGENAFDKGTPSAFVATVRQGPLGAVAAQQDPLAVVKPTYASVNGDVACNICGFKGLAATEIVGESREQCSNTQDAAAAACTLEGVQVLGADGQAAGGLPGWAMQAGKLYDMEAGALTGLLDSQVVTATLRVGCSGGEETCVQAGEVEDAIKASLGSDCARANVQSADKYVNHPALSILGQGIMSFEGFQARKLEGSAVTQAFDVAFTTHTPECTALVTEWVEGFQPQQLAAQLGGKGVEQAAADLGKTYTAKGMDATQAAQAVLPAVVSAMRVGAVPGVLVSAADGAGVSRMALPTLAQGGDAVMALTGFVPNKPVAFQVTDKCSVFASKDAATAAIGEFTPTEKGAVTVPFTVPELPKGTYSVRAEQSGLGFCSQPFQIE